MPAKFPHDLSLPFAQMRDSWAPTHVQFHAVCVFHNVNLGTGFCGKEGAPVARYSREAVFPPPSVNRLKVSLPEVPEVTHPLRRPEAR